MLVLVLVVVVVVSRLLAESGSDPRSSLLSAVLAVPPALGVALQSVQRSAQWPLCFVPGLLQ